MNTAETLSEYRTPPALIEAEMSTLGACLLGEPGAMDTAADLLPDPCDFYREAHRHIWAAMLALHGADAAIDAITVKDALVKAGVLEEAGGLAYLLHLSEYTVTAANVGHHAALVRQKSDLRRVIEASAKMAGMAYEGDIAPEAVVAEGESALLTVRARGEGSGGYVKIGDLIPGLRDSMRENARRAEEEPGVLLGVSTGVTDLDMMTAGLQPSDLVILAANASMGKTTLMCQMVVTAADEAAYKGGCVAVHSLEMSREQILVRLISSMTGMNYRHIVRGVLTAGEWDAVNAVFERLNDLPLFIDDTGGISAAQVRSRARRLAAAHGGNLCALFVDYLQLMGSDSGRRTETRNDEVARMSASLKGIAKHFRCPVVALSQLSRANTKRDDKRPQLSDLRDSGAVEQDADMVLFLYRPLYFQRKSDAGFDAAPPAEEEAEIIVAKQRNGPTGSVRVMFAPAQFRFYDLPGADTDEGRF